MIVERNLQMHWEGRKGRREGRNKRKEWGGKKERVCKHLSVCSMVGVK